MQDLKSRTTRAGLYGQDAVDLFLTVRLIVLLAGAGLILLSISWARSPLTAAMMALIIGGLAVVLPGIWLDRRTRQRHQAIAESLPETLELLVVCFRAGLGLEAALQRVAAPAEEEDKEDQEQPDDDLLRQELQLVLADMRLGMPVEQAFRRFAARIGSEETSALASVIAQATRLGSQIGELLRAHADKMRHQQLMELEEHAGKASAKLSLPLTLCLLPAGMLLLLGPAFYVVLTSF
jgi:tight adherence protein C